MLLLLLLLKMGKLRHKKVVALRLDPRLVSYLSEGDRDVICAQILITHKRRHSSDFRTGWGGGELRYHLCQAASKMAPNDPHLLVFAALCGAFPLSNLPLTNRTW